ncbi:MAG: hypothetical protein LLG00_05655 [Planctomycetaceae bacterium]|nr:hypothetical protein [Planctomycetaceae bacterium]
MSMLPSVPSTCGCCVNRRRFLAAGCGVCAASALPLSLGRSLALAGDLPPAARDSGRPRVRLVFACHAIKQDRATWPHIGYDFTKEIERVGSSLRRLCPEVDLLPALAHGREDAEKLLAADKADGVDGYVVYQMNNWVDAMQPIVASGKPTVIADFLFAGSGGVPCFTAGLARQHKNFSVVASSNVEDLARAVQRFAILKAGGTTAEFVASCDRLRRERTPAASNSVCKDDPVHIASIGETIAAMKRSKLVVVGPPMQQDFIKQVATVLGIEVVQTDFAEMSAFYEKADRDQARELAARWKSAARSIEIDDVDGTLEKSARNYLAQKAVLERHKAEAISINCLGGFYGGHLKAYPCLAFVELLNAGLVGACEGDIKSSVTMIAMKHLTGRPGFISDPVLDTAKRQIVYAHCVATTKPFGTGGPSNAYEILTHSEDRKGAAVRSLLPTGYMTTTLEIDPGRREILCHRAKAVENVIEDRACRTKLGCEVVGDMEKLFTFWDQFGWHRVTYYGDLWEPVKELAAALRFKFVAEA